MIEALAFATLFGVAIALGRVEAPVPAKDDEDEPAGNGQLPEDAF